MPKPIKNFKKEEYTDEFIKGLYTEEWQTRHFHVNRPKNKNFGKVLLKLYDWDSCLIF